VTRCGKVSFVLLLALAVTGCTAMVSGVNGPTSLDSHVSAMVNRRKAKFQF